MLGNDVVDLTDPEADERALHPRFDARAFGDAERARLAAAPEPALLRWALWAAKEAAYKAARRAGAVRAFRPRQIETRLAPAAGGGFHGEARVAGAVLRVRVARADGAVHALATHASLAADRVVSALRRAVPGVPDAAGTLGLELARAALGGCSAELTLVRRPRMPELLRAGAPAGATLTLSHHGRFVAAALALPERVDP